MGREMGMTEEWLIGCSWGWNWKLVLVTGLPLWLTLCSFTFSNANVNRFNIHSFFISSSILFHWLRTLTTLTWQGITALSANVKTEKDLNCQSNNGMTLSYYQWTAVSTPGKCLNAIPSFTLSHLCRLLWIQVEKCSLTALYVSLQTFSLQASLSKWVFKLKYRRPPTYSACCFLCKWCCVFKHSFILNPYFILPDINPVIFWQRGRQHSRGMPVAKADFDPSSQPHTWVMMALLVALSLCTPSLSLHTPPMNAVIDGQWRHPCLMCL